MRPDAASMGPHLSGRRRKGDAILTRRTFIDEDGRSPDLRVAFTPPLFPSANPTIPRLQTIAGEACEEAASSVSTIQHSASQRDEAQARAWKNLEHWASRAMWTAVAITLVVDLVATFGYRSP